MGDTVYIDIGEKKKDLMQLLGEMGDRLVLDINNIVNDEYASEDISEDCFVELIVRKKKFSSEDHLRAYMYKMARNKAYNHVKKSGRENPTDEFPTCSIQQDVLTDVLKDEKKAEVYTALSSLPDKYREVLTLIYIDELSYQETAAVMGLSMKQTDNMVQRAKKSLRERLGGANYEE